MLFDLRAPGRRRTVKAVYLSLAILMGGGLVLFGIGGDVQGGLFDAFDSQNSQTGGDDVVEQRLKDAETRVQTRPSDPAAWAALADVRFQIANNAEGQVNGVYTEKGKRELRAAQRAWERHLSLAAERPDAELANKMALALGQSGLQEYDEAVRAMELVIESDPKPSAGRYAQLAILASLAGQDRKSTLSEEKALELASSKEERDQISAQIALSKSQGGQTAPEAVAPATTGD